MVCRAEDCGELVELVLLRGWYNIRFCGFWDWLFAVMGCVLCCVLWVVMLVWLTVSVVGVFRGGLRVLICLPRCFMLGYLCALVLPVDC